MTGSDWDPTAPVTTATRPGAEALRAVVVGVGTVGLHHALAFAAAGVDVVGFDVDESVVAAYRRGVDATGTVGDAAVADSDCSFTTDAACIEAADVVFVSVPTRHDEHASGDVPVVRAAAETVGERLSPETTVVLESTVPPGATTDVLAPTLEATADLAAGDAFAVAHSPVRLSPGGPRGEWRTRTKLVGAPRRSVARDVATLYEDVYDDVCVVDDPATAAAAKCVENVHRDVNVALVNELASALDALDLDAAAVLDAAATKWNVPRLEPGLVGGTCLPEDPLLFADRVAAAGGSTPLVRTARAVNDAVPAVVASATADALAAAREPDAAGVCADGAGDDTDADAADASRNESAEGDAVPGDPTVLLLGLAYKPDVADLAGTRSDDVAAHLGTLGVDVVGHDPLVDAERAASALPFDVRADRPFEGVDGVVVLVAHAAFADLTLDDVAAACPSRPVVVDVPRLFDRERAASADVQYRCP
ncbi:nucleotide sugar dehydrogenase [Halobacterium yunchengense]|uniref:nucleotide sugar dehydrogenase n=1 Tax=Halobacterium yunchengense TaxID=3108497 RepID=UPI003008C19B